MKRAGGPVGLDVSRLDALEIQLGAINVTEGTGVRIGEARVLGVFRTGDIYGAAQGKILTTAEQHPAARAEQSRRGFAGSETQIR